MHVFVALLRAWPALKTPEEPGKIAMSLLNGASCHGLMKDGCRNTLLALTSPGNFPVLDGILSGAFPQTFLFFLFLST